MIIIGRIVSLTILAGVVLLPFLKVEDMSKTPKEREYEDYEQLFAISTDPKKKVLYKKKMDEISNSNK